MQKIKKEGRRKEKTEKESIIFDWLIFLLFYFVVLSNKKGRRGKEKEKEGEKVIVYV